MDCLSSFRSWLLIGLLLLFGCTPGDPQNNEQAGTTPESDAVNSTITPLSDTFEPADRVTSTLTRKPSPTSTATPTITPTATSTPTPSYTATPLPTLPPEEADALIWELLQNNVGCQLPCWWGAIPGKTAWPDFQPFLATLASEIIRTGPSARSFYFYHVTMSPQEPGRTIGHWASYRVRDGIIDSIETNWGGSPTYSLPQILTTYGTPDEVWLMTYQDTPTGSLPFRMSLLYAERGFVITYEFSNIEIQFNPYQLVWCSENEPFIVSLWLVAPEREVKLTFDEARETALHISAEEPYLRLSEATDMDERSFYETFKDPDSTSCLGTPVLLWPGIGSGE
jgi:hypothetical protein